MEYERRGLHVCHFWVQLPSSVLWYIKSTFFNLQLGKFDQSLLRRWRRNMMMFQDISRTQLRTHSGQRLLKFASLFHWICCHIVLLRWLRQLCLHCNFPHRFWERLHRLMGIFPLCTRYLLTWATGDVNRWKATKYSSLALLTHTSYLKRPLLDATDVHKLCDTKKRRNIHFRVLCVA